MLSSKTVRIADIELDLTTRELHSNGNTHHLQEKPFQILTILIEHPGQMVTRDELKKRLWPADTFVDFGQSLNKAVNRLREALRDSAEQPRFIETLPRRGYRLIASVNGNGTLATEPEPALSVSPSKPQEVVPPSRRSRWGWIASALILAAFGFLWWRARPLQQPMRELKQRQLTANPSDNAVTSGTLSPDGRFLGYADLQGIHVRSIATGDTRDIPEPEALRNLQVDWSISPNWFNEGTTFLASAMPRGERPSIWAVPVMGGAIHKIRDDAVAWSGSRDGSWVVFGTNLGTMYYRELWLMRPDGSNAHKLWDADPDSAFCGAEFSPDGKRVGYVKWHHLASKEELSIETRDLKNGPAITAVRIPFDLQDWTWAPDGRMITSFPDPADAKAHTCNFWQTRIDQRTGKPLESPRPLTNWSGFCMDAPSVTADGSRLAFRRTSVQSGIYVADLRPDQLRITAPVPLASSDGREIPAGWTPDSKAIIFISDRNGKREMFKQSLDRGKPQLLAPNLDEGPGPSEIGMLEKIAPRLSPDGAWVLYLAIPPGSFSSTHLMRVPVAGGVPAVVFPIAVADLHSFRCAKSPATLCLLAQRSGGALIFTAFDPIQGLGSEQTRFAIESTPDADYAWDLSPDGTRLAIARRSRSQIHLLSLTGKPRREITVKGWNTLQTLDWAPDGKALIASSATKEGAALLHVPANGNAGLLWEQKGVVQPLNSPFLGGVSTPWAIPSPDGRHLAICRWSFNGNIWMIEGF